MKKQSGNLPVGSAMRRKTQKGNSTPKAKKTRSVPRFFEVKIRITAEEYARGKAHFQEQKYLSRFVLDAYTEKVNRAEANSKAARLRILAGNIDLLEPILKEMFLQGKLNFLKEQNGSDA
jgi:hypothetical protein